MITNMIHSTCVVVRDKAPEFIRTNRITTPNSAIEEWICPVCKTVITVVQQPDK